MTEPDAHRLPQRLASGWIAQQRSDGTWIVACVPRLPAIRAGSVRADRGPAIDVADDPRPANYRNVPPWRRLLAAAVSFACSPTRPRPDRRAQPATS